MGCLVAGWRLLRQAGSFLVHISRMVLFVISLVAEQEGFTEAWLTLGVVEGASPVASNQKEIKKNERWPLCFLILPPVPRVFQVGLLGRKRKKTQDGRKVEKCPQANLRLPNERGPWTCIDWTHAQVWGRCLLSF